MFLQGKDNQNIAFRANRWNREQMQRQYRSKSTTTEMLETTTPLGTIETIPSNQQPYDITARLNDLIKNQEKQATKAEKQQ
jgi:hypothetical protein